MNNKNQIIKPLEKSVHKFDLEERTFNFASNILNFSEICKCIPANKGYYSVKCKKPK